MDGGVREGGKEREGGREGGRKRESEKERDGGMDGWRGEGGRERGREREREGEGGRKGEGGREGGREGERERWMDGGVREGGREGGREGEREREGERGREKERARRSRPYQATESKQEAYQQYRYSRLRTHSNVVLYADTYSGRHLGKLLYACPHIYECALIYMSVLAAPFRATHGAREVARCMRITYIVVAQCMRRHATVVKTHSSSVVSCIRDT